nr:MAG TPA: hypothetical protein [Caudoviricetes sp.]
MSVKGYKVFAPDWTCKGKQYTCPGTFEEYVKPSVCNVGMHFCKNAADCFRYYDFDPNNHVAEVIAHGTVAEDKNKCATNNLEIVREIPWAEVLEIVNTGKACTGRCNSGDRNSGNWNSGNWNSGDWNSGDSNSGDRNSGNWNSGNWNSGDRNSGDRNSGNWNSGDWNATSFSNGCFNTASSKIYMFNKPTDWTFEQWFNCRARRLLNQIDDCPLEYVYLSDMTDEEKAAHPEAETTGGYLKECTIADNAQKWWDGLNNDDRNVILSLPNFDAAIFKKVTGIDVNKD